jgi:hypothetical protein
MQQLLAYRHPCIPLTARSQHFGNIIRSRGVKDKIDCRALMSFFRTTIAAFFLFVAAPLGYCCSCSNNIPVQRSLERYRDRAVFKAHILGWLGSGDRNGHRMTDRALAIVREQYWGFPRSWPSIVIVESPGLCGMLVEIGKDYFISGWRVGYGEVEIGECSRTQLYDSAQVDLRTMDGSHCTIPGGSVLGHIYSRRGDDWRYPTPDTPVIFLDESGKRYATQSDRDGVYELNHLPPGFYTVEISPRGNKYASSWGVNVEPGLCIDMSVALRDYLVRGELLPRLSATVELLRLGANSEPIRADSIEPDGKFYFRNPPDGEYNLSVTTWVNATPDTLYFPGVPDVQQAERVEIKNHVLVGRQDLTFDPARLPIVKIPVVFDQPLDSRKYSWRLQSARSNYIQSEVRDVTGRSSWLYGTRGTNYDVVLYGWSQAPSEYGNCRSETITVKAQASTPPIQMTVPPSCR